MNENEFYKRVRGLLSPEKLRQRRAVIVGTGSGGARVAEELGRLGVELLLVDRPDELLEEHNIIRHPLGYDSLGKPKNAEMARRIQGLNPAARVRAVDVDVTTASVCFAELVDEFRPHLIAACTDNTQSKFAIELVARPRRIPVIGGGVYDGGVGGEVWISRPEGSCYGCIAEHLQVLRRPTDQKKSIDYNDLDVDEIRSTCALNLDIAQIALLHARVCLHRLVDGEPDLLGLPPEVNFITFANRVVAGVFEQPFTAKFFALARHPACLICGTPATASASAEAVMASLFTSPSAA